MTYVSLLRCRPCICRQPLHPKLFNNWVFPRQQHWQRCVSLEGSSHRVTTKKKQNHRISDGILIWMAPKKKGKKNQQTNILIYSNWAGMHLKKLHKKPNHTCFLFSKNSEVFLCWCQPVTFLALKAWTSGNTDGIHSSITSRNSTSLTIFQLQNPGNICTSLGWYLFWLA